jgi:threonine/homoserine/homoserine lactone efflux protein
MSDLLAPPELLLACLLASLVLAVTPGPAVVYILSRTVAQGRRGGLASALGVALGNLGNAAATTLGLAAVFAAWPLSFTVVKLGGALWLVWTGLALWRRARALPAPAGDERALPRQPTRQLLRDGALVALLNPKTTLFFAAFLPQFIRPEHAAGLQGLLLGCLFVLTALVTDMAYVLLADRLAPRLAASTRLPQRAQRTSAAVLVLLGVLAAWPGGPSP